jgi:hypothetical protein
MTIFAALAHRRSDCDEPPICNLLDRLLDAVDEYRDQFNDPNSVQDFLWKSIKERARTRKLTHTHIDEIVELLTLLRMTEISVEAYLEGYYA